MSAGYAKFREQITPEIQAKKVVTTRLFRYGDQAQAVKRSERSRYNVRHTRPKSYARRELDRWRSLKKRKFKGEILTREEFLHIKKWDQFFNNKQRQQNHNSMFKNK